MTMSEPRSASIRCTRDEGTRFTSSALASSCATSGGRRMERDEPLIRPGSTWWPCGVAPCSARRSRGDRRRRRSRDAQGRCQQSQRTGSTEPSWRPRGWRPSQSAPWRPATACPGVHRDGQRSFVAIAVQMMCAPRERLRERVRPACLAHYRRDTCGQCAGTARHPRTAPRGDVTGRYARAFGDSQRVSRDAITVVSRPCSEPDVDPRARRPSGVPRRQPIVTGSP
jgi:hypothetical protein